MKPAIYGLGQGMSTKLSGSIGGIDPVDVVRGEKPWGRLAATSGSTSRPLARHRSRRMSARVLADPS